MRAILIDPQARTVTEVEHNGDYRHIYELIKCETFTVVGLDDVNSVYVDDEGLLNDPRYFFVWAGYNQPLANNGLILGVDAEGETIATTLTLDHVKSYVRFVELSVQGFKDYEDVTGPDHWMGEGVAIIGHEPVFGPPVEDKS